MDIRIAAILLATFAFIGLIFLGYVLRKQIPLLAAPGTSINKRIRYILFSMTVVLFLCTLVILFIDVVTVMNVVRRSTSILNPIGVVYGFTIATGFMVSSAGWWMVYWSISRDNDIADKLASKNESDRVVLQGKNDTLQADNDKLKSKED